MSVCRQIIEFSNTSNYDTHKEFRDVKSILPHKYPFLMIDKILDVEPKVYAVGVKNVSHNEPIFQGHFPDDNIFPGAMLIEALAQMTGIMYAYSDIEDSKSKIGYLAGVNKIRLYKIIRPGDQIILKSENVNSWDNIIEARVTAYVDNELVAKGTILVTEKEKVVR